ncbi:hypothetical protein QBC45DRAFT_428992 [Copromyces sp. CBS 386.78]|nr:hypothetical protein QBC45DRAFT_428992 [Copromyces sp. CBS 386.78]
MSVQSIIDPSPPWKSPLPPARPKAGSRSSSQASKPNLTGKRPKKNGSQLQIQTSSAQANPQSTTSLASNGSMATTTTATYSDGTTLRRYNITRTHTYGGGITLPSQQLDSDTSSPLLALSLYPSTPPSVPINAFHSHPDHNHDHGPCPHGCDRSETPVTSVSFPVSNPRTDPAAAPIFPSDPILDRITTNATSTNSGSRRSSNFSKEWRHDPKRNKKAQEAAGRIIEGGDGKRRDRKPEETRWQQQRTFGTGDEDDDMAIPAPPPIPKPPRNSVVMERLAEVLGASSTETSFGFRRRDYLRQAEETSKDTNNKNRGYHADHNAAREEVHEKTRSKSKNRVSGTGLWKRGLEKAKKLLVLSEKSSRKTHSASRPATPRIAARTKIVDTSLLHPHWRARPYLDDASDESSMMAPPRYFYMDENTGESHFGEGEVPRSAEEKGKAIDYSLVHEDSPLKIQVPGYPPPLPGPKDKCICNRCQTAMDLGAIATASVDQNGYLPTYRSLADVPSALADSRAMPPPRFPSRTRPADRFESRPLPLPPSSQDSTWGLPMIQPSTDFGQAPELTRNTTRDPWLGSGEPWDEEYEFYEREEFEDPEDPQLGFDSDENPSDDDGDGGDDGDDERTDTDKSTDENTDENSDKNADRDTDKSTDRDTQETTPEADSKTENKSAAEVVEEPFQQPSNPRKRKRSPSSSDSEPNQKHKHEPEHEHEQYDENDHDPCDQRGPSYVGIGQRPPSKLFFTRPRPRALSSSSATNASASASVSAALPSPVPEEGGSSNIADAEEHDPQKHDNQGDLSNNNMNSKQHRHSHHSHHSHHNRYSKSSSNTNTNSNSNDHRWSRSSWSLSISIISTRASSPHSFGNSKRESKRNSSNSKRESSNSKRNSSNSKRNSSSNNRHSTGISHSTHSHSHAEPISSSWYKTTTAKATNRKRSSTTSTTGTTATGSSRVSELDKVTSNDSSSSSSSSSFRTHSHAHSHSRTHSGQTTGVVDGVDSVDGGSGSEHENTLQLEEEEAAGGGGGGSGSEREDGRNGPGPRHTRTASVTVESDLFIIPLGEVEDYDLPPDDDDDDDSPKDVESEGEGRGNGDRLTGDKEEEEEEGGTLGTLGTRRSE